MGEGGIKRLGWLLFVTLLMLASVADAAPIDRTNVANLQPAWTATLNGPSRATPLIDGATLLITGNDGTILRIDRKTGRTISTIKLPDALGEPRAMATRSIAVTDTAIVVGLHNTAIVAALDKATGALLWKTRIDDDQSALMTQEPAIVGDRIFVGVAGITEEARATSPKYQCCTFRGSIVALDRVTGKILWKTYTLPETYAGGGVWAGAPLYDAKRHTLFVTTGNAYHAPADVQACLDRNRAAGTPRKTCFGPGVWFDSIVALNPDTGAVKWGFRADDDDIFTGACMVKIGAFCAGGGDFDFANGALMWRAGGHDVIGAGQKSGTFWAVDPDEGKLVWKTELGPGGPMGGIEFGSALGDGRIFAAEANTKQIGHDPGRYKLSSGETIDYGSFAALDAATGRIVWQVADPAGAAYPGNGQPCSVTGPRENCAGAYPKGALATANGVVYGCTAAPNGALYAFDAEDGKKLWQFDTGASCDNKPVVDGDRLYWVSGPKLYAFSADAPAGVEAEIRPAGPSVRDGVYTAAQAERGKALYGRNCSEGCHNLNLAGQDAAPSLAGPEFRGRWAGVSLGTLFTRIHTTMPKSNPGSLTEDQDLAILAYLLASNGFPAGNTALPTDHTALDRISIEK